MKRIFTLLSIITMALTGCKSTKDSQAIVMAEPQFDHEVVWQLTSMRGKTVNYEEGQKQVTLQFNPEAGTLSGCSACNQYFASYKSDDKNITIGQVNGTKMACPEPWMTLERKYMQELRKVDQYQLGDYQLDLMQGETVILHFEKKSE